MVAARTPARRVKDRIRTYVQHHGFGSTLFHLSYRLANSVAVLLVFRIVVLMQPDLGQGLGAHVSTGWGFLSIDALKQFARDPSLELDEAFLVQAIERGDRCYGFIENGVLGAYAWYSTGPTPIQASIVAEFDPGYIYMHKAFTRPAFRGRGLYGTGVAGAARALLREGRYKGLISCVQLHNRPSLKGLQRIGFRSIGQIVVLGRKQPFVSCASPSCRSLFRALIRPEDDRSF